jgi:hypothetical protein
MRFSSAAFEADPERKNAFAAHRRRAALQGSSEFFPDLPELSLSVSACRLERPGDRRWAALYVVGAISRQILVPLVAIE